MLESPQDPQGNSKKCKTDAMKQESFNLNQTQITNLPTAQERSFLTQCPGFLGLLYSIVKDSLDLKVTVGGDKVSPLSN